MIGGSTVYLQPPVLYLGWTIGLFLAVGCPFGMFAWNQHQLAKGEEEIGNLSAREINEILDNPPTLKEPSIKVAGDPLTGFRLTLTLKMRNNRDMLLDDLGAWMEVTDLESNKVREKDFRVPDLGQREGQDQSFKIELGRSPSKRYKVVFLIYRMGFEVARRHFILERGLFDVYRTIDS